MGQEKGYEREKHPPVNLSPAALCAALLVLLAALAGGGALYVSNQNVTAIGQRVDDIASGQAQAILQGNAGGSPAAAGTTYTVTDDRAGDVQITVTASTSSSVTVSATHLGDVVSATATL